MTGEARGPVLPTAPPDRAAWAALPDDVFARIVPHVRRGLATLDDLHVTPEVRRLRSVPAPKLVRGRTRQRLAALLAEGGPAWVAVRGRILGDADVATALAAALTTTLQPDTRVASEAEPGSGEVVPAARLADLERVRDDLRAQRDRARVERDRARRRASGAEGRETSLRADVAALGSEVAELQAQVEALTADVVAAADGVEAAVARESRRNATERAELAQHLAAARRRVDELQRARREPTAGRPRPQPDRRATNPPSPPGPTTDRIVAGRPSRLPTGLRVDTREGAGRLVDAVGYLLVDGYNVTRNHRADLDLAGQRDWLTRGLEGLVARRRLDATVVFDAHLDGTASERGRARGPVRVVWSHPGVTADDELVFMVEALERDRPVVVVTDDRDLRSRLQPSRPDLLPTASLAWLLR